MTQLSEIAIARGRVLPDWAPAVLFEVYDEPIPQGSMRPVRPKGQRFTTLVSDNPRLHPWREKVRYCAMNAQGPRWTPLSGAVVVAAEFYMPKPKDRPKRRRTVPTTKPDLDKLVRAACDAMTAAGTYEDDARVIDLIARVRYAAPDASLALPWEPVVPAARFAVWNVEDQATWQDVPLAPFTTQFEVEGIVPPSPTRAD